MKALILKDYRDFNGPNISFNFEQKNFHEILNLFKAKVSQFELLIFFRADFKITDFGYHQDWIKDSKSKYYSEDFILINKINFDFYDIIITWNPIRADILENIKLLHPNVLFAFTSSEHKYWKNHINGLGYDLFLDHTQSSLARPNSKYPFDINYIFSRVPEKIRILGEKSSDVIYFDNRTLILLKLNDKKINIELKKHKYLKNFRINLPDKRAFENWFLSKNNCRDNYYEKLVDSAYFISVDNRVGQAAFDAASAGSLVIGNKNSKLHNLICNEICLLKVISLDEVLRVITIIEENNLYSSLFKNQEKKLNKNVIEKDMLFFNQKNLSEIRSKREKLSFFKKINVFIRRSAKHINYHGLEKLPLFKDLASIMYFLYYNSLKRIK